MTTLSPDQLLLDSYRSWLVNRGLSPMTIKNYISDVNRYFQGLSNQNPFSYSALNRHLQQLYKETNYPRYLASLRLFCQFGIDQKLITQNPLRLISKNSLNTKNTDIKVIINEFVRHLNHLHTPPSTIKNYVNDLNQYLAWLEKLPPPNAS